MGYEEANTSTPATPERRPGREATPKRQAIARLKRLDYALKSIAATIGAVVVIGVASHELTDRWAKPSHILSVVQTSRGSVNYLVERSAGSLGEPPPFSPDIGTQESHCSDWKDWLASVEAIGNHNQVTVEVRAPAGSPVTITRVQALVFERHRIGEAALLRCTYGAGFEAAGTAYVDLTDMEAPLLVDPADKANLDPFQMPPGRFSVAPGEAETLEIVPKGSKGWVFEFGLELTVVVDGKMHKEVYGTHRAPFRAADWDEASLEEVDWDVKGRQWGRPPY